MPLPTADILQRNFSLAQALGEKLIAGNVTMVPIGFDAGISFMLKQFPQPIVSGGQEIETFGPGGLPMYEQGPTDGTRFQGGVTCYENVAGTTRQFQRDVLAAGGYFDAMIYEGTPDRHTRAMKLVKCWIKLDPADRDLENRNQVVTYSGTMYGHFFDDERAGNI